MDRLGETLRLSDAQKVGINGLYQEYLAADSELRQRDGADLWKESEENASHGAAIVSDPALGQSLADLMRRCEAFFRKLVAAELEFFGKIPPMLAEDQLPRLERVKLQREIERADCMVFMWSATTVDLSLLLYQLDRKEAVEPVEVDVFDALVLEYERTCARLRTEYLKAMLKVLIEGPRLLTAWQMSGGNGTRDPAALEKFLSPRRKANMKAKHIEELNRLYVNLIADTLPPETATEFRRHFRESAYPEVFPDPFDVSPLFNEMLGKENLAIEIQAALQAGAEAYRVGEESLSNKMMLRVSERFDDYFRLGGDSPDLYAAFKSDLDALQRQRNDLAEKAMNQLLELVSPNDQPALIARITEFRSKFVTHSAEELGLSYRP